jgi:SNF2 family DNA or RNA helicase
MLEAVRAGRRYVPLAPGRFVALADSLRARLAPLAAFAGDEAGALEVAPSAAAALDDLHDDGARFDDTDAWRTIAERAKRARAASDDPPAALLAELRPYQCEGVRFLRRLAAWETGGVLADDMGLGKTVQAIALLVDRHALGPQLVLAPTSVCFNWQRELSRFAPSLRVTMLAAGATDDARAHLIDGLGAGDVLVAGYALAVQCADALVKQRFATAFLDEAQAVKNPDTQRARLARDLVADQKIALSGTPLENHLGELWSIFRIVSPGLLGSQERFRKRFAIAIERDRSLKKRKELAQTLRPFLLRRTKGEVARELPERTEIVTSVELTPDERLLYEATRQAVLSDVTADLDGAPQDRRFRVLAGLTRLRLLACHPKLVDEHSAVTSSKLQAVLRTIDDLRDNGHRALVFSQFVKHLDIVEAALNAAGVAALRLDGSTPAKERERRVDAFQAGASPVFLLSLKAGGAGLNLTAADYVLHLDPWWNPAVEDQAAGRAHRIGQTQPVTVYRFVARGTIEEQMLALHGEKRDLVDSVLEGADAAGKLSVDELLALVRGA